MSGDLRGINCGEDETDKKLVVTFFNFGRGGGQIIQVIKVGVTVLPISIMKGWGTLLIEYQLQMLTGLVEVHYCY